MSTRSFGVIATIGGTGVAGLTDVNIGGIDINMIDVTNHGSTGGWKEFISGLKDGGTIELSGNFDGSQTAYADPDGTVKSLVITFTDGSLFTANVFEMGMSVTNPLDDKVTYTISCKVTGAVTFA